MWPCPDARPQAESFAEWEAGLRTSVGAAIERLRSYEGFLGQALRWGKQGTQGGPRVKMWPPLRLRRRLVLRGQDVGKPAAAHRGGNAH